VPPSQCATPPRGFIRVCAVGRYASVRETSKAHDDPRVLTEDTVAMLMRKLKEVHDKQEEEYQRHEMHKLVLKNQKQRLGEATLKAMIEEGERSSRHIHSEIQAVKWASNFRHEALKSKQELLETPLLWQKHIKAMWESKSENIQEISNIIKNSPDLNMQDDAKIEKLLKELENAVESIRSLTGTTTRLPQELEGWVGNHIVNKLKAQLTPLMLNVDSELQRWAKALRNIASGAADKLTAASFISYFQNFDRHCREIDACPGNY